MGKQYQMNSAKVKWDFVSFENKMSLSLEPTLYCKRIASNKN